MRFGFHISIAGQIYLAIDRALKRNCETFQIFYSSPRSWQKIKFSPEEVEEFKRSRKKAGIYPLILHAPYLVNLGSPSKRIYTESIESLKFGLKMGKVLGAKCLVFHVGSSRGTSRKKALKKVAQGLREILRASPSFEILLENTSGAGFTIGSTFEELKFILAETGGDERVGICFDTAHSFAAGYDLGSRKSLDKTLADFDKKIGLERLKVIHANDSKKPRGSCSDRHEHIGQGYIGKEGFKAIVNHPFLKDLPFILETPGVRAAQDLKNLKVIKSLVEKGEK